ncbi:hypothetical protein KSP40_PGU016554 [Platanthera guangdongensis]|uniref:Uncharacterized protein n=1 Tax=Platanthera guangdongensis TaxID=2320717 RepID=A0ABR2M7I7_9ASPA
MESSLANRLPEADSLPDGFVDSSSEMPQSGTAPDTSSDLPGGLGGGSPGFRTEMEDLRVDEGPETEERITSTSTDSFAIKAAESTSSQDYKELEILPEMGPCYVEEHRHCQISVPGRAGRLGAWEAARFGRLEGWAAMELPSSSG